jgi:hypothetical protein
MTGLNARARPRRRSVITLRLRFTLEDATASKSEFIFGRALLLA